MMGMVTITTAFLWGLLQAPGTPVNQVHNWLYYVQSDRQCPMQVSAVSAQTKLLDTGWGNNISQYRRVHYYLFAASAAQANEIDLTFKMRISRGLDLKSCQTQVKFPIDGLRRYKGYAIDIRYNVATKKCECSKSYIKRDDYFL